MFKMLRKRKAQSTLEYAILIVIVIGALITIQTYIKRGIQGRLRQATDDIGDQWDTDINMTRRTRFSSNVSERAIDGITSSRLLSDEKTNVTVNMIWAGQGNFADSGWWPGDGE